MPFSEERAHELALEFNGFAPHISAFDKDGQVYVQNSKIHKEFRIADEDDVESFRALNKPGPEQKMQEGNPVAGQNLFAHVRNVHKLTVQDDMSENFLQWLHTQEHTPRRESTPPHGATEIVEKLERKNPTRRLRIPDGRLLEVKVIREETNA